MRIDKLFKVLVVGGSVLTAGCGDGRAAPPTDQRAVTVEADVPDAATAQVDAPAARDASVRADGVSSWMSWFVDPAEEDAGVAEVDAGPADVGAVDAGPADVGPTDVGADAQDDAKADAGVLAWLSWV
jgi:hypothetical protein